MTPVVELKHVKKRYGKTEALRDLCLTLPKGKIIGLMGANGAGKSTLLKLIAGVQRPSGGEVLLFGEAPGLESKRRTAYVPTEDYLHHWMRVDEVVAFHAALFPGFDAKRATALIRTAGLEADRRVKELSDGHWSRLAIALAVARRADLMLLDEPLANVDPASRRYLLQLILEEFRPGETTVLMTTHHVNEVEELLDHAVFLKEGRVAYQGEADALRESAGRSLQALAEEVSA